MKAKLEFDLDNPEEKKEHFRCIKSLDMACALFEIALNLKKKCRDSDKDVYEEIASILEENNLNIDELTD